jgi:hypothetical protein
VQDNGRVDDLEREIARLQAALDRAEAEVADGGAHVPAAALHEADEDDLRAPRGGLAADDTRRERMMVMALFLFAVAAGVLLLAGGLLDVLH